MLRTRASWVDYAGVAVFVGILGWSLLKSIPFGASDFSAYYFGGLFWRQGAFTADMYDTFSLNQHILQAGKTGFVSYTPFPPITAPMYAPLTFLDLPTAKFVFNLLALVAFTASLMRLLTACGIGWRHLAGVGAAFLVPLRNNVLFGQAYLVLCVLIMEGALAYERRHLTRSAVLWSLAIVWKLFPVILFLFVFWEKDWRHARRLITACLCWIGAGVALTGVDVWGYYLTGVLPRILNGEFNDTFAVSYQTFFVWLRIMFVPDALGNPSPVLASASVYLAGLIAYKVLLLGALTYCATKPEQSFSLKIGIWMLAALLLAPGGTTYSLILLVPLGIGLVTDLTGRRWYAYAALAGLALAANLSLAWVAEWPRWLQFPRLFVLLGVVGILVARTSVSWSWRPVLVYAVPVVVGVLLFQSRQDDPSAYVLKTDRYTLVYDFDVRADSLTVHFWTEEGPATERQPWSQKIDSSEPLTLRDNQIWCQGRRVTDSPDNKKKPVLLNGRDVVYLSDRSRGVGFYTLRKIAL